MSELSILVLAPPLNEKSAGIVALYRLYNELSRIDQTSQILVYQGFGNNFSVIAEGVSVEPEELGKIFQTQFLSFPRCYVLLDYRDLESLGITLIVWA